MSDGWFGGGRRSMIPILRREETIDEYLDVIKQNLLKSAADNEMLRAELNTIKKEAYASEEMQKMKARLEEMQADYYRGFPISEEESKAISEWKKKHDTTEHKNPKGYHGCSGGGYEYNFYPTAIGTSGVCICSTCRSKAIRYAANNSTIEEGYNSKFYKEYMKKHNGEFEFQELG